MALSNPGGGGLEGIGLQERQARGGDGYINFVQIDVDADGDGIDEFSVTTTWDALEQ